MCIPGVGGSYATVFYGSVEHTAGGSRARMGRVLGYVMAHEIGHLLLGPQHSAGVMAPDCRARDLLKLPPNQSSFTAADRERVSDEAANRAQAETSAWSASAGPQRTRRTRLYSWAIRK